MKLEVEEEEEEEAEKTVAEAAATIAAKRICFFIELVMVGVWIRTPESGDMEKLRKLL